MKGQTMKPPFLRTPYNYDRNQASDDSGLKCEDPTLAQQQYAEESDINYIADRYGLTGEMPEVLAVPQYGDFTGVFDYQTARNAIVAAERAFMSLPAKVRGRFANDPQKLLEFMNDPTNREEADFLGLTKKQEPAPMPPAPQTTGEPSGNPTTQSTDGLPAQHAQAGTGNRGTPQSPGATPSHQKP